MHNTGTFICILPCQPVWADQCHHQTEGSASFKQRDKRGKRMRMRHSNCAQHKTAHSCPRPIFTESFKCVTGSKVWRFTKVPLDGALCSIFGKTWYCIVRSEQTSCAAIFYTDLYLQIRETVEGEKKLCWICESEWVTFTDLSVPWSFELKTKLKRSSKTKIAQRRKNMLSNGENFIKIFV